MASYSDPATGDFGTSHILLVGHKVECTGSFSFTQAVYEAISGNTKSFTAALPASKPAGWAYKDAGAATSLSQQLDVTATVTRMLGATIGTCTKPTSAASRCLWDDCVLTSVPPDARVERQNVAGFLLLSHLC